MLVVALTRSSKEGDQHFAAALGQALLDKEQSK